MLVTDAGRIFMERASRALRELDKARLEIRPAKGAIVGDVNVGLLPSSCELLAAPLAMAVRAEHPGIKVSLSVGFTDHLTRWLEDGEIDVALLYDPKTSSRLSTTSLLTEPLWVCAAPSLGLATDVPAGIDTLGRFPLVLPSRQHGLRSLVERACAVSGIDFTIAAETNALAVHKDLVAQGMGLGVMPRVAIRAEIEQGLLIAAPLAHDQFIRTIALALPTARRTTPAVRCVTTALTQCMTEAVSSGSWLDAQWIGPHSTVRSV